MTKHENVMYRGIDWSFVGGIGGSFFPKTNNHEEEEEEEE